MCVRRSGEKYNCKCISTTVKHGGRGVIVWGAFSAAGTGELLHCEKSINALEYRNGLLPTIEKLFVKAEQSDVIFQQDNAPAYTAKATKTWLENHPVHQAHVLAWSESRFEPDREYLVSH